MKKMMLLALAVIATGSFSVVSAQDPPTVTPPPVADNATPFESSIKLRSVELERIKREALKSATLRREDGKELKFSIVKDDFEGIQKEQSKIIEAYTMRKVIDYKQISESSNRITEMAVRLRANVFDPDGDGKEGEAKPEEVSYAGKSVRDLIISLDNAIGEVVTSPMWQKLAVVDPKVSVPVEASLVNVIKASAALWVESSKMASK